MQRSRPPWWLYPAVAVTVLHFLLRIVAEFYGPDSPGWQLKSRSQSYLVTTITPGTPAARAGIQPGDVLLQWDGIPFVNPIEWFMLRTGPGRTYRLELERGGVRQSIPVTFGYRSWRVHFESASAVAHLAIVLNALLSLVVGLFIVWARPRDWVALGFAWALLVAPLGMHLPAGLDYLLLSMPEAIVVLLYLEFFGTNAGLVPSVLASVMNFPRPLAARRWYLPLLYLPFLALQPFFVYPLWVRVHHPMAPGPSLLASRIDGTLLAIYIIAGLVAIVWNYRRLVDANERRKLRVLMVGLATGFVAFLPGMFTSEHLFDSGIRFTPLAGVIGNAWFGSPLPVAFSLLQIALPTSIAYAILRHRVFDIRVIVRQGLQYAAARGLLLTLTPLCGAALAIDLLLHGDQPLANILAARGWWYIALAIAAFLAHRRQAVWLGALDRRFFRERYDAQRILTAVVEEIRQASDFRQAAPRVVSQIEAALHPQFTMLLLHCPGGTAFTACAGTGEHLGITLPAAGKLMALMRVLGKPVDCSHTTAGWLKGLPPEETDFLRRAQIEWVYPISIAKEKQEAVLALGPRRSEEPYSGEDQQLLEAVCSTLAILLERSAAAIQAAELGAEPAAEPAEILAGRYRLVRRLGRGGMGTVYEAFDTTLDRRVAVKLIRADLTANPDASARFVREAKAAAFGHPNVVTIHDFGVAADGRAYLVMELLEGVTLRQELRKEPRLDPARAAAILRDVCAAVEAAHSRRLLHRDLKPENIFLIRAAGVEVAKILDFGIAKPLSDGSETMTMNETGPGVVVGTPHYISPEQLRGEAPTERWDLWALAVVAYEMLTGAYPFATASGDWRQNLLSARVIPTRIHVPDAADSWDRFFASALAPDSDRRPASAARFLTAFQQEILPAASTR
jgi:hypothetical protein